MAVQMAEEDDEGIDFLPEEEEKEDMADVKKVGKKGRLEKKKRVSVEWKGEGEKVAHKTFYTSALVNSVQVSSYI